MDATPQHRMRIIPLVTPPNSSSPHSSSGPSKKSPDCRRLSGTQENPSTPTPLGASRNPRCYPTPEARETGSKNKLEALREKFAFKGRRSPECAGGPEPRQTGNTETREDKSETLPGRKYGDPLDPSALEDVVLGEEQTCVEANQRGPCIAPQHEQRGPLQGQPSGTPMPENPEPGDPQIKKLKIYLERNHKDAYVLAVQEAERRKKFTGTTIDRFCIILWLDVAEFWEYDSEMGQLMLDGDEGGPNDPTTEEKFVSASMEILQERLPDGYILLPEHIRLYIHLDSVPPFPEYRLESVASAVRRAQMPIHARGRRMQYITGVVGSLSTPIPVLLSQTYQCSNPTCNDPSTLHHALNAPPSRRVLRRQAEGGKYLPATTTVYLHPIDLLCSCCGETMDELIIDRQYSRRQWGRLDCPANLLHTMGACVTNALPFVLNHDLVSTTMLGDFVELIGILDSKYCRFDMEEHPDLSSTSAVFIKVNNLRRIDATVHMIRNIQLSVSDDLAEGPVANCWRALPQKILDLQAARLHPWSFSQRIVDMFGAHLVPPDTLRRVRLACLLSLVSTPTMSPLRSLRRNERPRHAIHVCAVSSFMCPALATLMTYAAGMKAGTTWGRWAQRNLPPLVGGRERETLEESWHRKRGKRRSFCGTHATAGPWDLARGGVLLLDSEKIDPSVSNQKAATKEIALAFEASNRESGNPPCIWMLSVAEKSPGSNKRQKATAAGIFDAVQRSCVLCVGGNIDKFDIFLSVRPAAKGNGLDMAQRILNDCASHDGSRRPGELMSRVEFAQYILVASNLAVRLTPECKELLKSYWQARRRLLGITVPGVSHLESLATMLRLTAAHAKLCVRTVAGIDDALASIIVYEEHTADRFESSLLGFTSLPDDGENIWKLYSTSLSLRAPRKWIDADGDPPESIDGRIERGNPKCEEEMISKLYAHVRKICKTARVSVAP